MIPPVSLQQQHPHQHRRRHSYQAVPLDLFSPPTIRIEAPSPAARPKIAFGKRRPLSTAALHGWLKDVEPLSPSARSPPTPVGSPKKPSGAPSTAASHYDADADDSEWAYPLSATPHDARLRSVEDLAERARRLDAVRDELLRQHTRLALDGRGPHERNRRAGGGDGLRKETLSKGLWSGIKNRFASSKSLANLATLADPSRRGSKLINKQDISEPVRRESKLVEKKARPAHESFDIQGPFPVDRRATADPALLASAMHSRDASSKRATAEPEMLKRWLQPTAAEPDVPPPSLPPKMTRSSRMPDNIATARAAKRSGHYPAVRPVTSYNLAGWDNTPTAATKAMRRSSSGPLLESNALWGSKGQPRPGIVIERGSVREASVYLEGLDRPTLDQVQRASVLLDKKEQHPSIYVVRTSTPPVETPLTPPLPPPSKHTRSGSAFSISSLLRVGSRRKDKKDQERLERDSAGWTLAGASPSTTTNGSTTSAPAPYAGIGKGRPAGVYARLPSEDDADEKTLRPTITRSASGPLLSIACCHCGGNAPPAASQDGTTTPSAAGPPQSVADRYMESLFAAIERRLSETKSDSSGETVTEGNPRRFSLPAEDVRAAVAPVIMNFFPPAAALVPVGPPPLLAPSTLDVPATSAAADAHGRYDAEMEMMTRSARFVHEKRARNRLEKEWMQQTFYA